MAGYDTLTISSSTTPHNILRLTAPDSRSNQFTMDPFDPHLNFEADGLLYVCSEAIPKGIKGVYTNN